MRNDQANWDASDYSVAMKNAITAKANRKIIKQLGDKILFNGFWRNGDKQNVCAWLDKATWHDAKTGQGGGCKEFAKMAFNMNLPEFMQSYGIRPMAINLEAAFEGKYLQSKYKEGYVNSIWAELNRRDESREDHAGNWLLKERGINEPRSVIGSGFTNLSQEDIPLFDLSHQVLISQRLLLGPNLVAPIRSTKSDIVLNLFLRAIYPTSKNDKARLLTGAGGFGDPSSELRAFGFPHLIKEFPQIVLCEGLADYFAAEFLLGDDEKSLPLGASNADALIKWANWLGNNRYQGKVCIVYQLDKSHNNGLPTATEIGQAKAIQATKILCESKIDGRIFRWSSYLKHTTRHPQNIGDLADSVRQQAIMQECGVGHLNEMFKICLFYKGEL